MNIKYMFVEARKIKCKLIGKQIKFQIQIMLNECLKSIFECNDVKKEFGEKQIFIEKGNTINQKKHSCVNLKFNRLSKYDIM